MSVGGIILLVLALVILAPIGDSINRWARTGGRYTPQLPDWLRRMIHRRKL